MLPPSGDTFMRRIALRAFLLAALVALAGCPRSEQKADDNKVDAPPTAPGPEVKVSPPSKPVDPDKGIPEEKPRF